MHVGGSSHHCLCYAHEQSGIKNCFFREIRAVTLWLAWLSEENSVDFSVYVSEIEASSSMRSLALESAAHKHLLFNRDLALGEKRFQHGA